MKLLVFSDTHGDTGAMYDVLSRVPCDMALHLGDCVADCDELRRDFPALVIRQVSGNDFRDVMSPVQSEDLFEAGEVRVFMTHGHRYRAREGRGYLLAAARVRGAGLMLYGHTHIADSGEENGVIYLNPGSASRARSPNARSYGVVTIERGRVKCEVVRF